MTALALSKPTAPPPPSLSGATITPSQAIDPQAYAALIAENERLQAALEFYADDTNYETDVDKFAEYVRWVLEDGGERARKALGITDELWAEYLAYRRQMIRRGITPPKYSVWRDVHRNPFEDNDE
jgi:hypothetical protein